jgi:hypothetical protein
VGCENHEVPGELKSKTPIKPQNVPFHWNEFEGQNALAKPVIEGQGMVFLDVAALSKDRSDNHRGAWDCLHYCAPGPVDYWLSMFHTAMSWIVEAEEVARHR